MQCSADFLFLGLKQFYSKKTDKTYNSISLHNSEDGVISTLIPDDLVSFLKNVNQYDVINVVFNVSFLNNQFNVTIKDISSSKV